MKNWGMCLAFRLTFGRLPREIARVMVNGREFRVKGLTVKKDEVSIGIQAGGEHGMIIWTDENTHSCLPSNPTNEPTECELSLAS